MPRLPWFGALCRARSQELLSCPHSLVTDFPQGVRECREPELGLEELLRHRCQLLQQHEEYQVLLMGGRGRWPRGPGRFVGGASLVPAFWVSVVSSPTLLFTSSLQFMCFSSHHSANIYCPPHPM